MCQIYIFNALTTKKNNKVLKPAKRTFERQVFVGMLIKAGSEWIAVVDTKLVNV